MNRQDKIELEAYRLIALLYKGEAWIGTRTLHEDNKTRDSFVNLCGNLRRALNNEVT